MGIRQNMRTWHEDLTWHDFPHYWPFVRGIHRSPMDSPHNGSVMRNFAVSLLLIQTIIWTNGRFVLNKLSSWWWYEKALALVWGLVCQTQPEVWTKWPSFCKRRFSVQFLEVFCFESTFIAKGLVDNMLELVQLRNSVCFSGCKAAMNRPSDPGRTRSMLWLLMPWLLVSSGHQHPQYWLCRINTSLSSTRRDFNYRHHLDINKW